MTVVCQSNWDIVYKVIFSIEFVTIQIEFNYAKKTRFMRIKFVRYQYLCILNS